MGITINDILKIHYEIQGKWWVSSKRLLADLNRWDKDLALLAEKFVTSHDIKRKFSFWHEIIEYILEPIGGRRPISENNCDCEVYANDLEEIS